MYITHDGQRLYLKNWQYNSARILCELVSIIKNNGGEVKPGICNRYAMVSNRTLGSAIRETREKLEKYERLEASGKSNPARVEAIKKMRDDLERWEAFDNTPFRADHLGYIRFILNGCEYVYNHDDNPFFDFYFDKTPILKSREDRYNYCSQVDKKEWMFDCLFSLTCSHENIVEIANKIFDMLLAAPMSKKVRRSSSF